MIATESAMPDPEEMAEQSADIDEPGAEPGFSMIEPIADTLVFYEVYRDTAAANAHTTTPHFHAFIKNLSLLAAKPISLEFLTELARK